MRVGEEERQRKREMERRQSEKEGQREREREQERGEERSWPWCDSAFSLAVSFSFSLALVPTNRKSFSLHPLNPFKDPRGTFSILCFLYRCEREGETERKRATITPTPAPPPPFTAVDDAAALVRASWTPRQPPRREYIPFSVRCPNPRDSLVAVTRPNPLQVALSRVYPLQELHCFSCAYHWMYSPFIAQSAKIS